MMLVTSITREGLMMRIMSTVEQIEQPEYELLKKQMLRTMSENQVTMITLDFADQHVNVNNQNG